MTSDRKVLTDLVRKHAAATGSRTGERLLEDPATLPDKFRVIVPEGFREAQEKAKEDK